MSGGLPDGDAELLAAEWAFGLLDPVERNAAEVRRTRDVAFDQACRRWEERATSLLDGPDLPPNPELWDRLSSRLPANDVGDVVSLRRALRRWRGAAGGLGMTVLALASAIAMQRHVQPQSAPPRVVSAAAPIVVILTSEDRRAIVSISVDRRTGRYIAANDAFQAGRHSAQLWVIPGDGVPRSLGLLPTVSNGSRMAPLSEVSRVVPGVTLAVSLEPEGGSPTGAPTGPVVLKGQVQAVPAPNVLQVS